MKIIINRFMIALSFFVGIETGLVSKASAGPIDIVNNGSFEEGLTDWTRVNPGDWNGYDGVYSSGYSGSYSLTLSNNSSQGVAGVQQTVATIDGQQYAGTFWWAASQRVNNVSLNILWDGQVVFSLLGDNNLPSLGWQQFSFSAVGTGSDVLTIEGLDPWGWQFIDEVSMTAGSTPSTVAEPASLMTTTAALAGVWLLVGLRRRQRLEVVT